MPTTYADTGPTVTMGSYYEAATPLGAVRLIILSIDPARHAVDAAVALDDCAPLLDELDTWVGDALDWRWCRSPQGLPATSGGAPVARVALVWRDAPSAAPRCRIELPWAMLRALPQPAKGLHASLTWPAVPLLLSIARFDLEPGESLALEPGGAVILPDSFSAQWRGRLRTLDEPVGSGVAVSLDHTGRARVLAATAAADAASEAHRYEIAMLAPRLIAADRVMGWSAWDFELPETPVRMWRYSTAEDPGECVASGQLIPWGQGFALAIEQRSASM